jgi:hypothetical protein
MNGQLVPAPGPPSSYVADAKRMSKNAVVVHDDVSGNMHSHGLKARFGDPQHPDTKVQQLDTDVDEKEFSFFNDLTRQFVKSAIIGGECHLVSLKTGQNKLAIYQVDKNLDNFFLIDQESGKSDLWGLSGIEVRPAPSKWSLSVRSADELAKMVLVKYTHPDLHPVTPLVVVSLKSKAERDLFYAGMKILRLYAANKTPRAGEKRATSAPVPETNVHAMNEAPPDKF